MSDIVERLSDGSPSECWSCSEWGCTNAAGHSVYCEQDCECDEHYDDTVCPSPCKECGGDTACTCKCHSWHDKVKDAIYEIKQLRDANHELFLEAKGEVGRANRVSYLYRVELDRADAFLQYIIALCAETHCAQGETAPCVKCGEHIDGIIAGVNTPIEPKPFDVQSLDIGAPDVEDSETDDSTAAETPDHTSELRKVSRILWNRRPDNGDTRGGDIDEIVCHDATVHVEQMNARCWWIGVYGPDNQYWSGNFTADRYGRMHFSQQDDEWDWEIDQFHDRNE